MHDILSYLFRVFSLEFLIWLHLSVLGLAWSPGHIPLYDHDGYGV